MSKTVEARYGEDGSVGETDLAQKADGAGDKFETIGRAGWLAKGVVYGFVGILFLILAVRGGSEEANQAGAIEKIAETPFGGVILFVLAIGLALYAGWRVFTVVLPGDWTGHALLKRAGYAVSAGVYLSLLWTTIGFLRNRAGDPGDREDRMIESAVKTVLDVPAGRLLIGLVGVAVIGVGGYFGRKGWTMSFREEMSGQSGVEGSAIDHLGRVGWIARGVSMVLVGAFLIQAAWTYDAEKAAGLDDSMRQITDQPFGAVLAGLVGAGFVAYGVFAGLSARHRNLEGPTNG